MKIAIVIVLSLFLIFLVVQVYSFWQKGRAAEKEYADVHSQLEETERDYRTLEEEYQYHQNLSNLEKELRARFNYKAPGEKMMIIVPGTSSLPRLH